MMEPAETTHRLPGAEPLSAVLMQPEAATALVVLAHGAGAGCRHQNMEAIATAMAGGGLATFRFNFPFIEAGRRRVDSQEVSVHSIVQAVDFARDLRPDLPIFAGGHSYGGRMTSHATIAPGLEISGLIFCSFPLHPAKKPGTTRAAHLQSVAVPMLFLSGTRDDLADASLLQSEVDKLPNARLHWLDTANHSYRVLKRQRQVTATVFEEMADHALAFVQETIGAR